MELVNDFTVDVPIDEAWKTLTDVERIAPCLPGAQLQEVEGDVYRGVVKVKVGPITAQFKGQATFVERDEDGHRAVLKAEGRDTAGKGNAAALITAQLEPIEAEVTKVSVDTDLTITGKVAQFGRGALADVSDKLLKQFVTNLETTVLSDSGAAGAEAAEPSAAGGNGAGAATASAPASGATSAPGTATTGAPSTGTTSAPGAASATGGTSAGPRRIESRPAEPIDLIETAGAPMLKRLLPVLVGVVVLVFILRRWRRD
jgi:carbon monoxide dehydrogenase subunit G